MLRHLRFMAIVLSLLLLFCASAFAFEAGGKTVEARFSGGLLTSGSFDASWYSDFPSDFTLEESTDPSWIIRAGLDCYIAPEIAIGASFSYAPIIPETDIDYVDGGVDHYIGKNDIYILDYCAGIRGRLKLSELLVLTAGLYAGGRSSFSSAPEAREFGMAIDGDLAIQAQLIGGTFAFAELGFLSQPYGGVIDIAYVRGGPILFLTMGIGF